MQDLQRVGVYTDTLAPVQELFSKIGGGVFTSYFTVLVHDYTCTSSYDLQTEYSCP